MTGAQVTVFESQVDWLSCATHRVSKQGELGYLATELIAQELKAGNRKQRWGVAKYEGLIVGRVRWGAWRDWRELQLSGQLADDYLSVVAPIADSITRIDLAVTVRTPEPDPHLGPNHYLEATWHKQDHKKLAKVGYHADDEGGYTLNVGSRESAYWLRIYNKEAEQRSQRDDRGLVQYRNAWRYELECKGVSAAPVALSLPSDNTRPAHVQDFLHKYLTNHGIAPRFPASGNRVLLPGFRRRSDRDSRLRWFREQVAPAMRECLDGTADGEVYEALGLAEPSEDARATPRA